MHKLKKIIYIIATDVKTFWTWLTVERSPVISTLRHTHSTLNPMHYPDAYPLQHLELAQGTYRVPIQLFVGHIEPPHTPSIQVRPFSLSERWIPNSGPYRAPHTDLTIGWPEFVSIRYQGRWVTGTAMSAGVDSSARQDSNRSNKIVNHLPDSENRQSCIGQTTAAWVARRRRQRFPRLEILCRHYCSGKPSLYP